MSSRASRAAALAPLHSLSASRSSLHSRPSASSADSKPGSRSFLRHPSDTDPPQSHIPSEFHVREHGTLLFPSKKPAGDTDVPRLEHALYAMLASWQERLESHKPGFPMRNSLWGLMQVRSMHYFA